MITSKENCFMERNRESIQVCSLISSMKSVHFVFQRVSPVLELAFAAVHEPIEPALILILISNLHTHPVQDAACQICPPSFPATVCKDAYVMFSFAH
jgi:hypothetical protein